MIDNLGGRKFIYALLASTLGFVIVLVGKIDAKSWLDFVEIIGATYVVGNIGEKVTTVLGSNSNP